MCERSDKKKGDNATDAAAAPQPEVTQDAGARKSSSQDSLATVISQVARQLATAAVRIAREHKGTG